MTQKSTLGNMVSRRERFRYKMEIQEGMRFVDGCGVLYEVIGIDLRDISLKNIKEGDPKYGSESRIPKRRFLSCMKAASSGRNFYGGSFSSGLLPY